MLNLFHQTQPRILSTPHRGNYISFYLNKQTNKQVNMYNKKKIPKRYNCLFHYDVIHPSALGPFVSSFASFVLVCLFVC